MAARSKYRFERTGLFPWYMGARRVAWLDPGKSIVESDIHVVFQIILSDLSMIW